MPFTYQYARPALTVDVVLFALDDGDLKVLLIERAGEPFAGSWALPGGFVDVGERPEDAAKRELQEETGLKNIFLEQLYTFGEPDRDPREHVVTVAHFALVNRIAHKPRADSDARAADWFSVNDLPELAFDHNCILSVALERLRGKVRYQPIGFELLPKKFTLRELQHVYEVVLGRSLDARSFRRRVLGMGIVVETPETNHEVGRRAARYRFDKRAYARLMKSGFHFEI